jgi:restriction endonuclease S subunit
LSVAAVRASELIGARRIDAEAYQPALLSAYEVIDHLPHVQLGEVAFITDGQHGYHIIDETSDIKHLTAQCIRNGYVDVSNADRISAEMHARNQRSACEAGDVVLSTAGTIGNAGVVTANILPANMDQDLARIKIHDQRRLNPWYVATFLNSRFGQLQTSRESTGQVQQHLALEKVRQLRVPLLDGRDTIAQKAQRSFELFRESEALYTQAQSLLSAELGLERLDLSEEPVSVRRVSEVVGSGRADAEYYKRKYLNLLSYVEEKPNVTLDEIATFSGGATPLGAKYLDEGIPFLRIQNVGENRLVMDDVAYIDEAVHTGLLKRSQLAPRDVLITITGRIGTSAVVPDDLKQGNINQHIVRMRLKSKVINPYYLAAFMNSVGGKLQTERESYGTTRDALPYYCLARIRVLKADAGLQNEIERTIRKADEASSEARCLLAEARAAVERMIEG